MSTPKSGSGPIGVTGPAASHGGTTGHLPAGYGLREFQIERVVGEGGFSIVYLATDTRLERQVAIKEYMPTALATRNPDLSVQVRSSAQHREAFDAGLRSFINEAKLLARFEHRALVKVHQFWQDMGTAYMVMPYYEGPTLKHWIRQTVEPVDPTWLEQFMRLLMDALETLHRENCLHRDVAPDNILILNERTPLLLDFGAARRVIGDLTQALTVILKPGFAPIEQYAESQSMRQGPWTDVYALCAVAHFMITGRAPTPSVTRVLADDLVPLSAGAAGRYPAAFLAALDAGLTVRPQQRPQSIAALRELMNGTAQDDHTLTAPPGRGLSFMETPATSQPMPTTIRPLTPTIAPPPGSHYEEDDDKTRIATTRDFLQPRTSPETISQPAQPALAKTGTESAPSAAPAAETTPPAAPDQTAEAADPLSSTPAEAGALPMTEVSFGTRVPSRTMRDLGTNTSPPRHDTEDDKASLLPLALGGVGIALVIGTAWALINWMNGEYEAGHRTTPTSAPAPSGNPAPVVPPPAPVRKATAPDAAPASTANASPSAAAQEPSAPKPATAAPHPPVAMNVSPKPVETPAPALSPSTPPKLDIKPEATPPPPAPTAVAKAAPSEKPAQPTATAPRIVPTPSTSAAAKPEPKSEAAPTKSGPPANRPAAPSSTVAATKPTPPANDEPRSASMPAPKPDATKSGPPTGPEPARARPATSTPVTLPPYEPQVAPSVSVPPVATVDASPPPPQVAAVEPPRAVTPPAAAAAPAPLRAVSKPAPMFPREAVRAEVDKGKVRARLFIASDGTVSKVEILSAYPARVFDREVRETAMRWRYDPPGQPRQTDVEFDFDRFKER